MSNRPERPFTYHSARAGKEPAEALTPNDRRRLVRELHAKGMTDVEIAEHTRQTTYTAARIRREMWLEPNVPGDVELVESA